jgi:MFS transporter, ACS family, solute carrier family 17 (sodium-dependent inorganic phosphate cotransporter), other
LYGKWQIIFGIVAFSYLFGASAFVLMGRGELQPWNNPPEKNGVQMQDMNKAEEGVPLKTNNAS